MNLKKLCYAASVVLAACLIQNASAAPPIPVGQTNYFWTAAGDATTWSQGANWRSQWYDVNTNLYNASGIAPVNNGTTYQIFIGTGYPTTTPTPIMIGVSDAVRLNDSLFGPEWGETLNISGSVTAGFANFPIGDSFTGPSTINLYGNGSLSGHDTLTLGDTWWFPGGPNVVMNLRDNSQATCNYFWLGGHLNLYGGMVSVTNFAGAATAGTPVFTGGIDSDATRAVNLVNGKLVLPASFTSTVNDWISRGILFAYGKKYQSTDLVINEADPNYPSRTVVSTVPLGGNLQLVHFNARTNMMVGTFQQAPLVGNYPSVTNVVLSYLDPATVPTPTYQSSAPDVASVTANGQLTALKPGTATITGTSGANMGTAVITVTPYTNSLIHRYSFSDTSDSVGGSAWAATLYGATLGGGAVTLNGADYDYVQLPAGIVSGMDAVTIEAWANFSSPTGYATFFAFGAQDILSTPDGMNYICFQPFTGITNNPTAAVLFGRGDPGNTGEQDAVLPLVVGGVTNYLGNVHIACVFHPYAGYVSLYTNGVLAAINSNVSNPLADTLGADPLNYLGASLYANDPGLTCTINEFRIYNGALTAGQILADQALGPNQLIGTNRIVSLSAKVSGDPAVVLSWPTNSALVDVMSSSTLLGAGTSWSAVIDPLVIVSTNYQMTIPATSSVQFFRLQQY